jgi:hypothetical protein
MRHALTALIILMAFITYSCQNAEPAKDKNEGTEIMQDNAYEKGFALTPLLPKTVMQGGGFEKTYLDTLDFGRDGSSPVWHFAQWHSKFNLAHAELQTADDGSVYYINEGGSKKVALYPDNSLLLEVNASKEYDSARVQGQPWPHLLIAQNFNENSPNVGEAGQLLFSMELKLEKEENKMAEGTFNTSVHTAQSPFYFILKNGNENSPDYNQKIWFGIPSYDYRFTEMNDQEKVSWDIGTSTFIYNVPQKPVWGEISFQDKKWHKAETDLKPFIIRALEAMREKEVFMNTTPNDLVITGMNFGWEVPGTFDVALRVKNISLKYIE